ncbi:pseudaminic acid cytidylyltransferase [Plesiomonas sp.]|uniref:pseudaminic acid cytidylyltransferase n=1 Tax=Plesiomonas sp. TaxID=2486279 RepID=UPI003F2FFEB0
MNIAIIPARGGSKRIPNKNIKSFSGVPLLARAIETAKKSKHLDKIYVSTDSEEIAAIAVSNGAIVKKLRPAYLADDFTSSRDVIRHEIAELKTEHNINNVLCLYPTSPLLKENDIDSAYEMLLQFGGFIFSAANYCFPPQRALNYSKEYGTRALFPQYIEKRSQDLEDAIHDAGQFYWASADDFSSSESCFSERGRPFILNRLKVMDIDTIDDWNDAETLFKVINT